MIHGNIRPQPIHKGAIVISKDRRNYKLLDPKVKDKALIGTACGAYGDEPPLPDRYLLWTDDWSEVTCRVCLKDRQVYA